LQSFSQKETGDESPLRCFYRRCRLPVIGPAATLARKGEKNFQLGIKHEAAQQWDRAAQELTLAVAADPSNLEFQLQSVKRCTWHRVSQFT
jgi:hypothetical protein